MTKKDKLLKRKEKLDSELQDIEKEEKMEKQRIKQSKQSQIMKAMTEGRKRQFYWIDRPASHRLCKLICDMVASGDPVRYFHYQFENYNLKELFKKLNDLEYSDYD